MAGAVFIFCVLAVFVQAISTQYIGNPLNAGFNLNAPYGPNFGPGLVGPGLPGPGVPGPGLAGVVAASNGGGFAVKSSSPLPPTGISVLAENLSIEGPLVVGGQLPFLGSVGLEGALPGFGAGTVSYGCGNGNFGIINEVLGDSVSGPYGLAGQTFGPGSAGAYGPALSNSGIGSYGNGLVGPAYGSGLPGPGLVGPGYGSGLGYKAGIGPLK